MNTKNIATLALVVSIAFMMSACDSADARGLAQTTDPAPTLDISSLSKPPAAPKRRSNTEAKSSSETPSKPVQMSQVNSGIGQGIRAIEGKTLFGANEEELGYVERVVIDRKTGEKLVIIGLGEMVNNRMTEVLAPLEQIRLSDDGDKAVTNLTKLELAALPGVDTVGFVEVNEEEF